MEVPSLVIDLAVMLLTAGIVSILFRKIHLPAILGYILAGFFISPYFPLFLNVENQSAIDTLSELGVIIILFHIGLEFDFHKLLNIGSTAIVTAVIKMSGVMIIGYFFGMMIGLDNMNSLFLGAMLSISSTVVIQKCFAELNVEGERYTSLVLGTLIMEDLLSVFIMVILSTLSVSKNINGGELAGELLRMGAYLIVWLLVGIFVLPTFLNKIMGLMNREMLVALSLGICFSMALFAEKLGFSVELGAFLAGSLFAGTAHAGEVEEATSGVKDMFSVIFFLAVGMKVDPDVIVNHWQSIIPIAIIAVAAKLVFATLGMVLSGQSLSTAVKSGFSLAPIGEFSFIIASLGISLGVMDEYLYPVIVSASILTTLITPTLINNSGKVTDWLISNLPGKIVDKMEQYSSSDQVDESSEPDWGDYLGQYFRSLLIYGVLMIVTAIIGMQLLLPLLRDVMPAVGAKILVCVLIYSVMALFLRPMLNLHNTAFTHLWFARRANRPPLVSMIVIKLVILLMIAYSPLNHMFGAHRFLVLVLAVIAVFVVSRTDFVATTYLQVETRFLRNLNERIISAEKENSDRKEWLDEDLNIISFVAPEHAAYANRSLQDLHWGKNYNALVVKVRRGKRHYLLPSGNFEIHGGDKVYLVGDFSSLENMQRIFGFESKSGIRTLRRFMESDYADTEHGLACVAIKVCGQEPFAGSSIKSSNILTKAHCMVLGIEKDGFTTVMPDANMMIQKGDILWIMGSNNNVGRLAALSQQPPEQKVISKVHANA